MALGASAAAPNQGRPIHRHETAMITPDYRAALAQMLKAAEFYTGWDSDEMDEAMDRARALLAAPEPVGPTDEELLRCMIEAVDLVPDGQSTGIIDWEREAIAAGRAVLARWGRPAVEPVPTPEPGTADHITDDEGTRWDRTMDAALWAKAFCLICPEMASREDVMIGWFANAIMAGCDHQAWKMDAERKPVPVSERLPGPEDCDAMGRCWWFTPRDGNPAPFRSADWSLYAGWRQKFTHWRPYHALSVPEVTP